MSEFDPYLKWLGIREATRPINHYRLLGLDLYEADPDVISMAADRQMTHIRTYQSGPNGDLSQQLLNELARARRCLLNPDKKADYDDEIRASLKSPVVPASPAAPDKPAPPLAVPPPPVKSPSVDVVQPEFVESSSESGIAVSAQGDARGSNRRRERKQMAWSLFGWVSGGLAAVGIGAWLIGSGLLPNSKPPNDPDPDPKIAAVDPSKPGGNEISPSNPDPKRPSNTDPDAASNTNNKNANSETGPVGPPKSNPPKSNPPKSNPPKSNPPNSNPPSTKPLVATNGNTTPTKRTSVDPVWRADNIGKYPRPTADARTLLGGVGQLVASGKTIRFEPSRSSGGTHETELKDRRGALLIGLVVAMDNKLLVKTVQPIYLSPTTNAYLGGAVGTKHPFDPPTQPFSFVVAKPDYAVGEIKISVLDPIRCLRVKFMRITKDGLNPADFYWSDWIGDVSGPVKTVTNDEGVPIVGFYSRFELDSGVATLGLVGAGDASDVASAAPAVATNTPLDPGPLNPAPSNPANTTADLRKTSVPSKRELEKAMDLVERNYRDSIVSIRSVRDLQRLARQLVSDGRSDTDDPNAQYARFEKARQLGVFFGDARTAVESLRAMDDLFEFEFWDEVLDTIEDAELKANSNTQADFKRTMEDLINDAIADQQFGPAGKLIASASLMAKRARDVAAQDKYKNLRKQIVELGKIAEQSEKAREKLAADPDDPDANLSQGDYLFVVVNDWQAAFKCWSKSNDAALKELVKKESSVDKRDGDQLAQLADDWLAVGKNDRTARDRKCLERARLHYRSASGLLSGLARKSALSKVKELDQILN